MQVRGIHISICAGCAMILLAAALTAAQNYETTSLSTTAPEPPKDVRLPKSVIPIHYDVTLHIYMHGSNETNFHFKGEVKIQIRCINATDNITLHANVLSVDYQSIRIVGNGEAPSYTGTEEDKSRQFIIIKLNRNLTAGREYSIQMNFTSILQGTDMNGLYFSSYKRDGQIQYTAATQFQATDARKAFPCFDEPSLKATFKITLIRPENLHSISNMPQEQNTTRIIEDGLTYVKDVYQTTPKMSTYLVAFLVNDFTYISNVTKNGVLYRVWSRQQAVNSTRYALDIGVEILPFYEEFFNISFPLPKQDMAALTSSSFDAMENWGLVLYRETHMTYQPGVSSEADKENVAIVVSHELAHQWFGNLVSPSWWDDLWLNEGFASFILFLGVDHVHPEWKMLDYFVTFWVQKALAADGTVLSHPIYVPVATPEEVLEIFDTISYAKGACVIRMLRHFLGYDTFKRGMTRYLKSLEFRSAFHDDLWTALEQQARMEGKDFQIKDIMDTWILQMNYPVVNVTRLFSTPDTVVVSQERYLEDKDAPQLETKFVSPFNYTWTIPITFTTSTNPRFIQTHSDVLWLKRRERSKNFALEAGSLPNTNTDWIIANVEANGFYRVNYDTANWRAIAQQLKTNLQVISVINRAQIIDDAWYLAKGDYIGLDTALRLVDYLDREREYMPWNAAAAGLGYVAMMISNRNSYERFKNFMQLKLGDLFNEYRFNISGASHFEVALRVLLANEACRYEISLCLETAWEQFQRWMRNPSNNPIDPNFRETIYCYGIATGGVAEWNFALQMYQTVESASEAKKLLSAMACTKSSDILNNYVRMSLSDNSPIKIDDVLDVIRLVAANPFGQHIAWTFFTSNYDEIKRKQESNIFSWLKFMEEITTLFRTPNDLQQVNDFYATHKDNLGSGVSAFKKSLGHVNHNVKWLIRNEPVIERWLQEAECN